MFPFLSSARIHLNSRCLSQAVFDSGGGDFDAEVIRASLRRGSALCCRSGRSLVPVREPGSDPSAATHQDGWMDEVLLRGGCWQRRDGGGLSPAPWAAQPRGAAGTERLRGWPAARAAQRLVPGCGQGRSARQRAPRRWRCGCQVNANLCHLRSLEFLSNRLAVRVAASFCTGTAKLQRFQTSAKKKNLS